MENPPEAIEQATDTSNRHKQPKANTRTEDVTRINRKVRCSITEDKGRNSYESAKNHSNQRTEVKHDRI
jgi:hypothetical protein